jgi:hypothetical protein
VAAAPDLLEDLPLREHPPRVLGEQDQQPVLDGCQADLPFAERDLPPREVDAQVADVDEGRGGRRRGGAAERGADPGEQLADPEGLREVVVGARIEGLDLVRFPASGRDDDDGNRRPAADLAGEVDAVAVGEPEVEEDDLRALRRDRGERLLRGPCLD